MKDYLDIEFTDFEDKIWIITQAENGLVHLALKDDRDITKIVKISTLVSNINDGTWFQISGDTALTTEVYCECGSDSVGSPGHARYCPKYEDIDMYDYQ